MTKAFTPRTYSVRAEAILAIPIKNPTGLPVGFFVYSFQSW